MKTNKYLFFIVLFLILMSSCQDFLDREPLSSITPENYLNEESQLAAYAIARYNVITDMGYFEKDHHTDIQARRYHDNRYVPGEWKVPQSGGDWAFGDIYQCNYFLERVIPKWKSGLITGNVDNINHYIGEVYFLRAYNYFNKLVALGDFPIIKTTLPDNHKALIDASKRMPRTEVARFIISDLDSAIMLMKNVSPDGRKNRLSSLSAQLFKSRVSLFEGSWLKYFKGTEFVPNGPNWAGAQKDYNNSYTFPSGSIDGEIDYFLTQAMESAKVVASTIELTENNMLKEIDMSYHDYAVASAANPYLQMFSEVNLSPYSEVLFWRAFNVGLGVINTYALKVQEGDGVGYTRGFVDGYLMLNGLPIYAENSGYLGDDYIKDVRKRRDRRLNFFLAEPGQINILYPSPLGTHGSPVAIIPDIMNLLGNHDQPTGYHHTKGNNYDGVHYGQHTGGSTGSIIFRAAEAYLNYIEACYEKKGALDVDAMLFWKNIRERAGVDTDIYKTINATDLVKESRNDWGVYSAGNFIDKTLYNIRRERKSELIGEGLRYMDLKRWRALDQMVDTPYHVEGFKLWGPMKEWYPSGSLTYSVGNESTVSDPKLSAYLRIYQKTPTSLAFNGYRWTMAHYLNPIAVQHFLITTENADVTKSPIYQNPGWPIEANKGAVGY
ncbi:MAG: RagB/SusD family nutrient uptake outer membrane protein [Parabacteroides sp.]|nr:RagB/SusD family nutrient uptake outer membrane protein [Parabacteroides sp.]